METRITRQSTWIVLRFIGKGTTSEVKAAYLDALNVAEAEGLAGILIDSVDSTVHPGFDDMRDLAHFALSLRTSKLPRTALIVGGTLQFGLARMFASLVEFADWDFRIFKDAEAASAWMENSDANSESAD